MTRFEVAKKKNVVPKSACIAILIVMVVCGFFYKTAAIRLEKSVEAAISLPIPLRDFPVSVGDWMGKDVPLEPSVMEAAANDDFCSWFYLNKKSNYAVNVYIAYSARPRTMLGHRPDACYVGAGWILESTEVSSFFSKAGLKIPCLLHRFRLPQPKQDALVVLNFYIINGKTSADELGFSGMGWRTPNINGDIARYVAQVQISGELEDMTRTAARDMADTILEFFPDANGIVRAVIDAELKDGTAAKE